MPRLLIVLGDTAAQAIVEGGVLERLRDSREPWQAVLASSEQRTVQTMLVPLQARDAAHLRVVELRKSDVLSAEHWDDLEPEFQPFRFAEKARYRAGDAAGAVSRADAAMRAILSFELPAAIEQALHQLSTQEVGDLELVIHVVVLATTYRRTGSGALVPLLSHIKHLWDIQPHRLARLHTDVILGSQSVNLPPETAHQARLGRHLAMAELALAEDDTRPVPAGPGRFIGPDFVRHVIEVGAPPPYHGMIADEAQARRALTQALELFLFGPTGDAVNSMFPSTAEITAKNRPGSSERQRFSSMGAVDLVLEPEALTRFLQSHLMAHLPPVPPSQPHTAQEEERAHA